MLKKIDSFSILQNDVHSDLNVRGIWSASKDGVSDLLENVFENVKGLKKKEGQKGRKDSKVGLKSNPTRGRLQV